ncbi:unnamed protein product [Umbelopsis vinacea]
MTDLRRFSTTYLQSGRRKVLVPYCEHDNSDAVLNQCVDDKTLLPTDSICLVNVVTPGLLSQLTAYNLMQGASPVSTAMDFTCTAQPNPHREFMVARAEDMLENVAQRLRNKDHLKKNVKKSDVIIISPDNRREVVSTDHFAGIEEEPLPNDLSTGSHEREMDSEAEAI